MKNVCLVCGYCGLSEAPYDNLGNGTYVICDCCGFEYGLDDYPDKKSGILSWRKNWIATGYQWFSSATSPPRNWDGFNQLNNYLNIKKAE